MKIEAKFSRKRLLWQLVFLCVPTMIMVLFILKNCTNFLPVFSGGRIYIQTLYFTLGTFLSCILYSYRFRFLPSFLVVLSLFYLGNYVLDNFAVGEFDSFFLSIDFFLFSIFFITGWICGWGFSRMRYFSAFIAVIFLGLGIYLIAYIGNVSFNYITLTFLPIIFYSFYIIYMSELVRNTNEQQENSWLKPIKGFLIYTVSMLGFLLLTFSFFKKDFKAIEAEWNEGLANTDDKYSMYQTGADSTIKMKDKLSLQDKISRGSSGENVPVFVTYLDNFFPKTDIPNPLYFVTEYLTKFDDYTETFERDTLMPYNDLFSPDPSSIPLYFSAYDSVVLINGMGDLMRRIVEAEVYKINGSPQEFTAPSTAFFCQPIAVKNELKDQFKSAYRAKMWVSELNSAYFVYNNTKRDWMLQQFQEQRFNVLRTITDYKGVDTAFYNYYTSFPSNPEYDTIRKFAAQLIEKAEAKTPIDKILAIRNFFMSGDDEGKDLFEYSDIPGPVPSGSRLLNFLFNERKGYCAYFAGSTLFLLRACGIPSRLTTGYAIVDRSSNNKGWYWVYAKQSHAWVQAFFPGYGWLDFDTTYGDSEQQEAPETDGTPPLDPQKAWFAGTGKILTIDTLTKNVKVSLEKMMYKDLEYKLEDEHIINYDLTASKIYLDSLIVKISELKEKQQSLALSFTNPNELPSNVNPQDIHIILSYLPSPLPIDEFRVDTNTSKENSAVEEAKTEVQTDSSMLAIIIAIGGIILLLVISILSVPYFIYKHYSKQAKQIKDAQEGSYYPYRATMFLLHQLGYLRGNLTPLQYARQKVDEEFGTSFEAFTATYLKVKYAQQTLSAEECERIFTFFKPFEQVIKLKVPHKKWILSFMNIYNTINYFTKE